MKTIQNDNELMKRLNRSTKFLQNNNMKIVEVRRGFAKIEMNVDEKLLNLHGFVHGGVLFSMADTVAGAASFTTGKDSVTLNGSINYIKPGIGGTIYGIAQEVSSGNTTGVYEVFIFNDNDQLLCRATFTMYFIKDRK